MQDRRRYCMRGVDPRDRFLTTPTVWSAPGIG
jgi:hypothetical protein